MSENQVEKTKKKMSINLDHQFCGNVQEDTTWCMSKALGFKLTRINIRKCLSCAVAEVNPKNVPNKSPHEPAKKSNGRLFLDISTIKAPKEIKAKVTKPNWRIIVDEHSVLNSSQFYYTKDGIVDPTYNMFNKWKPKLIPLSAIRCDNSGEKLKLEQISNQNK